MEPWFCYGAELTDEEREELHRRFYAPGPDGMKRMPNKGWPTWAEGVLSPARMAAVEEYDRRVFAWERRRERLMETVMWHRVGCRQRSPDIITLAECDHFDDFWGPRLEGEGYEAIWRKRPREHAKDGCAIAWRRSTFDLVAEGGFDFGLQLGQKEDRTCCFALIRWRRDPSVRLLVATAHLQRNPESMEDDIARGYQYGMIFRELLAFAGAHDAEEVPVILTGDLNAKDCDELAGIARALVRLLAAPTHPLLWSVMDAPTPPTTLTEERHMRIDYILYQSDRVQLAGIGDVPKLLTPIPDDEHPSDHLPVSARLTLKSKWAKIEEDARQWLACVSGTTTVRPLSGDALRLAFNYFDKDATGEVSLVQLEAGMQTLGFPGLDTTFIRDQLRKSDAAIQGGASRIGQSEPAPRRALWDRDAARREDRRWVMDLEQFVHLYTICVQRSSSAMAAQVEKAFATFDPSGSGVLHQSELREALQRMASAPLDERRLDEVLAELAGDSKDPGMATTITIASFARWMMGTYTKFLQDPSLVQDSVSKWPAFVYNQ